MRAHQNFTLGMLVEEVQPLKDAALYCMGGHYCRAADLELDTGDSIETELAELGAMLQDVISEPPATAIFTSGAEDCGACVDAGDKAVMQDVIAKVLVAVAILPFACFAIDTPQQIGQELLRQDQGSQRAAGATILRSVNFTHNS